MIRWGICAGIEKIDIAAEAGFDYLEAGLAGLCALTDEAFEALVQKAENAAIGVEAFNGMVPGDIALTGPNVSREAITNYLDKAFERASRLNGKVIVFGSGAARRVPEGFDKAQAMDQLVDYLTMCVPYCERTGIVIAIEPLRQAETNIVHTVREGAALAARVNSPSIGTLGDTFHMVAENEPLSALTDAGKLLNHVHIAEPTQRVCPKPGDGYDYGAIVKALNAGGYQGRVSIEGGVKDIYEEGKVALAMLRAL